MASENDTQSVLNESVDGSSRPISRKRPDFDSEAGPTPPSLLPRHTSTTKSPFRNSTSFDSTSRAFSPNDFSRQEATSKFDEPLPPRSLPIDSPKWQSQLPGGQIGMKILNPDAEDVCIDLVAIHGLGAIPDLTWTEKNSQKNWLRDFLPETLPRTRIMRFGYDSLWLGKDPIRTSLDAIATLLLEFLRNYRKGCPNRPIIFVGHCFGGLVIEKTLARAHTKPHVWSHLLDATVGIVFLGTPHRGSKTFTSGGLSHAVILAMIAASSSLRAEFSVVKWLDSEHGELLDVSKTFVGLIHSPDIRDRIEIACFFEQRSSSIEKITGSEKIEFIVNEASASLDETDAIPLNCDHFSINKYSNVDDGNLQLIMGRLGRMHEEALRRYEETRPRPPAPFGPGGTQSYYETEPFRPNFRRVNTEPLRMPRSEMQQRPPFDANSFSARLGQSNFDGVPAGGVRAVRSIQELQGHMSDLTSLDDQSFPVNRSYYGNSASTWSQVSGESGPYMTPQKSVEEAPRSLSDLPPEGGSSEGSRSRASNLSRGVDETNPPSGAPSLYSQSTAPSAVSSHGIPANPNGWGDSNYEPSFPKQAEGAFPDAVWSSASYAKSPQGTYHPQLGGYTNYPSRRDIDGNQARKGSRSQRYQLPASTDDSHSDGMCSCPECTTTRQQDERRVEAIADLKLQYGSDLVPQQRMWKQDLIANCPLYAAVYFSNQDIVHSLLHCGEEINFDDDRLSCRFVLQLAASRGDEHMVKLLVAHGASIGQQGGDYGSALQAAASEGHTNVVNTLFDLDTSNEINLNQEEGLYGSALQAAASKGHTSVVRRLLLEAEIDIDQEDDKHPSALYEAAKHNSIEIIDLLLSHKADVSLIGRNGSALDSAIYHGNTEAATILLESGAKLNLNSENKSTIAMRHALKYNHKDVASLILSCDAHEDLRSGIYPKVQIVPSLTVPSELTHRYGPHKNGKQFFTVGSVIEMTWTPSPRTAMNVAVQDKDTSEVDFDRKHYPARRFIIAKQREEWCYAFLISSFHGATLEELVHRGFSEENLDKIFIKGTRHAHLKLELLNSDLRVEPELPDSRLPDKSRVDYTGTHMIKYATSCRRIGHLTESSLSRFVQHGRHLVDPEFRA